MTTYEQLKALNEARREAELKYCTIREAENENHLECRFENGEKYAAVTICDTKQGLCNAIYTFLDSRPALAELEKLMEPIGGLQESIFYFEKYLNECRANLQSQKQLADIQALNNIKSEPLWPVLQIEQLERVIDQMQSTLEAAKRFQQMSEGS